ncbi:MAG: hypothetical protein DSM106950_22255 [Stigonema ocellatum SAG 48.90 = DSM 106950]|nr:hypothetical protein [Stigonema ocellatum SAG 48.90 = DSM 106950]
MLKINTIFGQLRRKIAIIMLAGLVLLISLPVNSVQAGGHYTGDYATRENIEQKIGQNDNVTPDIGGEDYVDSGRRAAEVIPKDLGTGSRQKNPIEMLKRAGEELGNNQIQRAFGAEDYERSPVEQELARNKAQRGDY